MTLGHFRKDESLDRLADVTNVAQFVSFTPGMLPRQAYARVLGLPPNHRFSNLHEAIGALMAQSPERTLNVRSFAPNDPKSHEFLYGLASVDDVESAVVRIAGSGLNVIVNETVDVKDGGVSGVVQGGVIEFAPDDTPRCVEKPGTASLPEELGQRILSTVYRIPVALPARKDQRLEFTIHPKPRGWKHTHILGWELEDIAPAFMKPAYVWPNHFSRLLGDKAFGLLLGWSIGLLVPRTTVIGRRVAPFSFGDETRSAEVWIRTCPFEQVPGRFTTNHGWLDPYQLVASEDPTGKEISSLLAQAGVPALYSGALIVEASGKPLVEGTVGEGERLMKGEVAPARLPSVIVEDVLKIYSSAHSTLGPVRFEWVHDGDRAWLVQLHKGETQTEGNVLVPGSARVWREFDVSKGLEKLRAFLSDLGSGDGLVLVGRVGVTSHMADVVRKAGRPARLH
jgi:hypothetical protein